MESDLFRQFADGVVVTMGQKRDMSLCEWSEHKDFSGVFLKNVVTADQTGGSFSCHLVRIEPHCKIGLHTHPASIELHEVVAGNGICLIGQEEIRYRPGTFSIIARNAQHEVQAGAEGLCMFAKFITVPA